MISFAILSGMSYYLSNQSLTKSTEETARALGTDYANQIQADIQEKMIHLEEIALLPQFQSSSDKTQIIEVLAAARNRLSVFDNIVFMSSGGTGFRADGSVAQYNDDKNFKKVLATKKANISEPMMSKVTGKMVVVLTVPVLHNSQLMGMISGVYSLEKLSERLKDLKFKETGFGILADQLGTVLAHPDQKLIGKLNLSEKKVSSELKVLQTQKLSYILSLAQFSFMSRCFFKQQ
jgi:methyl-accepting chemotaxis protein